MKLFSNSIAMKKILIVLLLALSASHSIALTPAFIEIGKMYYVYMDYSRPVPVAIVSDAENGWFKVCPLGQKTSVFMNLGRASIIIPINDNAASARIKIEGPAINNIPQQALPFN